jgi:hypothetical protein
LLIYYGSAKVVKQFTARERGCTASTWPSVCVQVQGIFASLAVATPIWRRREQGVVVSQQFLETTALMNAFVTDKSA